MKVRVYYGETEDYNYIIIIMGYKFVVVLNEFNFIEISRENVPSLIKTFKNFKETNFLKLYKWYKSFQRSRINGGNIEEWLRKFKDYSHYKNNVGCGEMTFKELTKRLKILEKITEIE